MSPEEDRTRNAVDSEPKHYQLSYSGPPDCYYSSVDETSALPCGVASVMDPDIMKQVHFLPQSPELSQKFLFPIHFSSSVFHCSLFPLSLIRIIIMITLKCTIQECLQSCHCAANCLQHVRSSGWGAIGCKLCATHPALVTCKVSCATWYEGTAQLLSLTELKLHLF